ncbi:MAG: DUF1211 domain-containing protein [Anaerolineales bacterium]|nr:DUF1211 domain-containing protein [Anaerolineales bacterium]
MAVRTQTPTGDSQTGYPQDARPKGVAGNERINALSDGVFAIVITLLVLELKVPEIPHQLVSEELPLALLEILPKAASHVVSFVVLGVYWVGHHNMFMHIKRHDRVLLWLNILFLMCVASMPFPTGLIVQYSQERWPMIIYAATLVAAGMSLDLIWWYATSKRRLVNPDMKDEFIAFVHRRVLLAPMLYLSAIGVSFMDLSAAKLLFLLTPLLYIFPNPLDRHHHKEAHKLESTT